MASRPPARRLRVAAAVDKAAGPPATYPNPPDRFRTFTALVSWAAPASLILVVAVLFLQARPSINKFGLGFFVGTEWNPVTLVYGARPAFYGTEVTSALATAISLPVGIAVAVVLAEPGARGIRGAMGIGIELLAAIPSVVYGIWALYVLAPWSLLHL